MQVQTQTVLPVTQMQNEAQAIPFTHVYLEWQLKIAGPVFANANNKFSVLLQRTNEIRARRTQLEKEKSTLLKERKCLTDVLNNHFCKLQSSPVPVNFQPGLDPSSNNKDSRFLTLFSQTFGNLQH